MVLCNRPYQLFYSKHVRQHTASYTGWTLPYSCQFDLSSSPVSRALYKEWSPARRFVTGKFRELLHLCAAGSHLTSSLIGKSWFLLHSIIQHVHKNLCWGFKLEWEMPCRKVAAPTADYEKQLSQVVWTGIHLEFLSHRYNAWRRITIVPIWVAPCSRNSECLMHPLRLLKVLQAGICLCVLEEAQTWQRGWIHLIPVTKVNKSLRGQTSVCLSWDNIVPLRNSRPVTANRFPWHCSESGKDSARGWQSEEFNHQPTFPAVQYCISSNSPRYF